MTRFPIMMLGLVRIEGALLDVVGEQRIRSIDRKVIARSGQDRHGLDLQVGHALDEIDDLGLDLVDAVQLAALQRGDAGRGVVDYDDLDLVGKTHFVGLPEIGEALAAVADAGLVDGHLIRPRTDAPAGLSLPPLGWMTR